MTFRIFTLILVFLFCEAAIASTCKDRLVQNNADPLIRTELIFEVEGLQFEALMTNRVLANTDGGEFFFIDSDSVTFKGLALSEILDTESLGMNERVTLKIRTAEGVALDELCRQLTRDQFPYHDKSVTSYEASKILQESPDILSVTSGRGGQISGEIIHKTGGFEVLKNLRCYNDN